VATLYPPRQGLVKGRAAPETPVAPSIDTAFSPEGGTVLVDDLSRMTTVFLQGATTILDLPSCVWHRRSTLSFVNVSTAHMSDPEGERPYPSPTIADPVPGTITELTRDRGVTWQR